MKASIGLLSLLILLTSEPAHAADPGTCSEAYRVCAKPDFGHCDAGCVSTCRLRFEGCMKTGSFATPRALLKGLKQR
jgi:hypothetical protein